MNPLNSILPGQISPDMANMAGTACKVEQLPQEAVSDISDFGQTLEEVMIPLEMDIPSMPTLSDSAATICHSPEGPSPKRNMPLPEQVFPPMKGKAPGAIPEVTNDHPQPKLQGQETALLITAYGTPAGQGQRRDMPSEELRMIEEAVAALQVLSPKPEKASVTSSLKEPGTASASPAEKEQEESDIPDVPEGVEDVIPSPYSAPAASKAAVKESAGTPEKDGILSVHRNVHRQKETEIDTTLSAGNKPKGPDTPDVPERVEDVIPSPYGAPAASTTAVKESSGSGTPKKNGILSVHRNVHRGKETEIDPTLFINNETEKTFDSGEKIIPGKEPVLEKKNIPEGKMFEKREKAASVEASLSDMPAKGMGNLHARPAITSWNINNSRDLHTLGNRAIGEGVAHVISLLKNERGEKKGILRVEPPELGKVKIVINSSSDEVHVHLTVEKPEAGDLVKESEDVLREALKERGLSLGDLSVDVGNNGEKEAFTGKEEYNFHSHASAEPEMLESEEDAVILARIDLEQGILQWIA